MKVLSFVSKYTIAFFIIAGIVITIYVSGTNKDQFGVHTDAIIKDDAGVVVYDNYLESGNPFE